jgi:selenocysteine lyase/cysteine desulfurase
VTSTRIDMEDRGLSELVRASVHYYNSEDEVDRFCAEVARLS